MCMASTEVETTATLLRLVGDGHVVMQDSEWLTRNQVVKARRPAWKWTLSTQRGLADLLPQIIPYLTGKRERAEQLLEELRG